MMRRLALWIYVLLLLVWVAACTTVDLCYEDYHPHLATITARYNWGTEAADAPAEMNIVASRIFNTWRNHGVADTQSGYCRQGLSPSDDSLPTDVGTGGNDTPADEETDTETGGSNETGGGDDTDEGGEATGQADEGDDTPSEGDGTGDEENPGESGDTPDQTPEEPAATTPFRLRGGEYKFFSINAYRGLVIDSLQSYLDNHALTTDTLFFHLQETAREELPELSGMDMPDFNPRFRYVRNPGRLFYATKDLFTIHTGQEEVLEFDPVPISKKITIKFQVRTVGDVQIDSLIAEMSGICGRFNISQGYLDTTNLYRYLFLPELEQQQPVEGEAAQQLYTYSATFHVMGLVPSYRDSYLIGPGILQLAVYASTGSRRRIFYAGANPRQDLVDAHILRVEGDKTYLDSTEPLTIFLNGELVIDEQHIQNRDDGKFDIWFSSEQYLDVDV